MLIRLTWGRLSLGLLGILGLLIAEPQPGLLLFPPASVQYVPPCAIQGQYYRSPYEGDNVTTQGIVYLDLDETPRRGFFIQLANCDDDVTTSDGLFVYLGERLQVVHQGDHVEVSGLVQEYFGFTELVTSPDQVRVILSDYELPPATPLAPPFDLLLSDPYLEALEGMRVTVERAAVVGPTDPDDKTWVVPVALDIQRVFAGDPRGTGEIICLDDEGLFEVDPEGKVGDEVDGVEGALDYALGTYCVQLSRPSDVYPSASTPLSSQAPGETGMRWRLATYNLANLFDASDDPNTEDSVLSAAEYQRRLQKHALAIHNRLLEPELIAVQEAENLVVLQALLIQPEIEHDYGVVWYDSPDVRGIDIALLYRLDCVAVESSAVYQGCTTLIDGFGPDGNLDASAPQNAVTCDSNGDGELDGNRLFSRPPLAVDLRLSVTGGELATSQQVPLTVLVNHWKSKTQDTDYAAYTLPRRVEQARFVARLGEQLRINRPESSLILVGDFNDDPFSQPMGILVDAGWQDLTPWVEPQSRYTYIYHGISQVLDYALVKLTTELGFGTVEVVHSNADFPAVFAEIGDTVYRASDHDVVMMELIGYTEQVYLPHIFTGAVDQ